MNLLININPLLGAEPNKLYFVIKHGELINAN